MIARPKPLLTFETDSKSLFFGTLRRALFACGLLTLAPLAISPSLFAQTVTTGQITGIVTDPAGAVVPNTKLTLTSDATGEAQTATSNSSGEFRFSLLRPGSYTLLVNAAGFQETTQKASVDLGQSQSLNVQLGVQRQSTTVEVSAATPLLQSDNANLATSFNTQQLENLPAPGNDMTAYAFNAPGVTVSTGGGYGSFSAFGLPATANLFTINGNDNMDPYLNLNNSGASNLTLGANEISDAVVVLNGYTGQYGRQAGANVNYVTKSGTNMFHGNANWQYNSRVMNANDWFNNATGTPRPFAVSNEWYDSIGGPVIIPKLFDGRNKLFFFVDNEGLRYVLPGGGPVYVPTQSFSQYVLGNLAATNPAAVPFYTKALSLYSNSTGAGRLQPVTSSLDPALGCGDFSGGGFGAGGAACAATFRSTVNNLNTEWLLNSRVDYNPSSRDQIYFRYNTDHGVQATGTDAINPAFSANSVQPSYGGQFGYTRTFTPTVTNQLLLSASYYTAIFGPSNLSAALATFPTTFNFQDGLYTNLGGSDYSYPQGRKVRQWQLVDDFSVSRGTHTIKFGANVRKNFISTYAYGAGTSGLYTFNSMTDFVNGSLGNGSTYAQSFSNIGAEPLTLYSAGFYAQDEWKVRPNLTLTLALRMDRNGNIRCASGCFNELATQPFLQLVHDPTIPYNTAIKTGLTEAFPNVEPVVPAPRVGFAWNARKTTVFRGGFGIFSDLYQGLIADRLITNAPGVASFTESSGNVSLSNDPNSAASAARNSFNAFQQGFASGATVAQLSTSVPGFSKPNFNTIGNELYNPKYYEWNFEVQQDLGKVLVSANYVGNSGYQELNQNLLRNAYAPNGFQALPTTVPDARFGEIRELTNNGFSNYNGLVGAVKWRLGSSFTGSASYTWSHALDTCSNECLEPFNALSAVSYRYQLSPLSAKAQNYGSADYDVRHSMNANYVYTVPTSTFHNGVLKNVLGGWTVAGTFFFHSGYPFTIVNSSIRGTQGIKNASGIATQPIIADYIAPASVAACSIPNVSCYSASEFASAANQTDFGNLSRNAWRGPGYFDTDMNVNKVFTFHERAHLLIGAYFFNILNHPNFDLPTNNVASGSFGSILNTVSAPTSAYGSFQGSAVSGRVIQTQVKLSF